MFATNTWRGVRERVHGARRDANQVSQSRRNGSGGGVWLKGWAVGNLLKFVRKSDCHTCGKLYSKDTDTCVKVQIMLRYVCLVTSSVSLGKISIFYRQRKWACTFNVGCLSKYSQDSGILVHRSEIKVKFRLVNNERLQFVVVSTGCYEGRNPKLQFSLCLSPIHWCCCCLFNRDIRSSLVTWPYMEHCWRVIVKMLWCDIFRCTPVRIHLENLLAIFAMFHPPFSPLCNIKVVRNSRGNWNAGRLPVCRWHAIRKVISNVMTPRIHTPRLDFNAAFPRCIQV